ncbi:MAG: 3-deoxy-manno-octulosonate cytidylyltransferase [Candidatus Aminicenantes bacterium]|nr:3-deoxy-manno-octulosonate cytidylyltransferase [Candidatus Aminicenantes bacterium]
MLRSAVGIIPARYGSRRFPGKPLTKILGKPMLQWVYERASSSPALKKIIIATDDERILDAARLFDAETILTSPEHASGTDRVAEVAKKLEDPLIINIQGDEPLIRGEMITALVEALQDNTASMSTLAMKSRDEHLLKDANTVKVIFDKEGYALYFSRSPIPYNSPQFWIHIGIYGYQREFLLDFSKLEPTFLENTEKLEQLRALEYGYKIKIIESYHSTISVDVPEDITKIESHLKKEGYA